MPPTTNSDSEDDLDYVPPANESDSESSDDHFELGSAAGSIQVVPPTDPCEQKKQRESLWASFQASLATSASSGNGNRCDTENGATSASAPVKRVKIERSYLFAGKHVTEIVEVPGDSDEAKKWPRWSPRSSPSDAAPAPAPISPSQTEERVKTEGEVKSEDQGYGSTPLPATPNPAPPTKMTSTPGPGAKRPGPRKPRTTLPSIPKGPQAKKITTLDKSAMDWRAHLASQSSNVKDELDANRRGGGYLEKVEFLKRVEDRREDAFQASKANKRQKT